MIVFLCFFLNQKILLYITTLWSEGLLVSIVRVTYLVKISNEARAAISGTDHHWALPCRYGSVCK